MPIYKTLEDKFECMGVCKPSTFQMTKEVTAGPVKQACAYAAKSYVDEYAASWGGGFIFFLVYLGCYMCWGCSTMGYSDEEKKADDIIGHDDGNVGDKHKA